jgi:hypothetical protein
MRLSALSHTPLYPIMPAFKSIHRQLFAVLVLLLVCQPAPAQQSEPTAAAPESSASASLSLFVFLETNPRADIEVMLDGRELGQTEASGRLQVSVEPGTYQLQVSMPGQPPLIREFRFTESELVQILVNFFADQSMPFIDIESSNPDKIDPAAARIADVDAEPGLLQGQISSAEDGKAIAGVRVFVSGVADEQVTDADGRYYFELPPGAYALSVLASRYNTRTLENIPVSSGETTTQDLKLSPAGSELPEYVVVEPYVEGSLASVLDERRQSSSVADILSAEQFAKTGDSDAASALKRVPGLSLVGGKFVFVRGLGERYSSTLINGMPVPSPDPTRNVIPLDIFPTSVIKSISVQKTLSPDMPGEFGGGTVNLRTNGIPETGFLNIGVSGTYDSRTTFKTGLTSQGSPTDFLGFDNGARALPDSFDVIADTRLTRASPFNQNGLTGTEIERLGEDLSNVWDIQRESAPPSFGIDLAGGDSYQIGDAWRWGFTGSLGYDQDWDTQREIRRQVAVSSGEELQLLSDLELFVTNEKVETSSFLSTEIGRTDGSQLLKYTMLLVRQSLNDNRITEGFSFRDGFNRRNIRLRWTENEAFINQLTGHHEFSLLQGLMIDWGVSRNTSEFREPNRREARFDEVSPGQFSFSRFADNNLVRFTKLDELAKYAGGRIQLDMQLYDWLDLGLYAGGSINDRNRDSSLRRFQFAARGPDAQNPDILAMDSLEAILSNDFIGDNGFQLREGTLSTDFYIADQRLSSYFFGGDWTIADTVRVDGGVRVENNEQVVTSFEPFVANPAELRGEIVNTDYLPAVTTTWTINDQHQIKLAFSESVIRPQFREFAAAPFNDPTIDSEVIGNPDLVQSDLKNYDIRWDWFFTDDEFISFSGFYKTIDKPIELQFLPTSTSDLATLENADNADLLGVEFEFRFGLSRLWTRLDNFYLSGNFSLIDSEVDLGADAVAQTNQVRKLQGQSDSIINLVLGYENLRYELDATLSFNKEGSRISTAGIQSIPDSIESPPAILDFVMRKQFGPLRVAFNASNLLDETVVFSQREIIKRSYKSGREFKLSLDYSF